MQNGAGLAQATVGPAGEAVSLPAPRGAALGEVPSLPLPPSIYLDGCAWGCGFYVGVQAVFERLWGQDFGTRVIMQGDSAGALVGVGWSLGLSSGFIQNLYADLAGCGPIEMMKLKLSDYHDAAIDAMLEACPDAHIRLRGRMQIGVTLFPRQHVWVSEWRDQAHLRDVLHCSMHIPVYCREVPYLEGRPVVDGGVSIGGQHLAHGDRTLVVSAAVWVALPGERIFDVSEPLAASQCLFPPSTEAEAQELFKLGESVALEWVRGGGKLGTRKRRSWWFKRGGVLLCTGMWGLRALEQYALPRRVRLPPKKRTSRL